MRNDLNKLANSEVRIRKVSGQTSGPHKCVLNNDQAIFLDAKVDVEHDDELLRTLPTGKEEVFTVVDVQYQPAVAGLPASYTAKLRKGPRPQAGGAPPVVIATARSVTVFVSWSGQKSHAVALVIREWLPRVLPGVIAWVSSEDIAKGSRWSPELERQLREAEFGIICLVEENIGEPWVLFESGALSLSVNGQVAPFLVGIAIGDAPGPLQQFQCTIADKADVLKLVRSISKVQSRSALVPDDLDVRFEAEWSRLGKALAEIEVSPAAPRAAPPAPGRRVSHEREVARDRTMALAREWSGAAMIGAREALAAWIRTKTRTVNVVGALLELPRQAEQVRHLVEFIMQVGALARVGVLDRELAQSLFGAEMIRTCYDLEGGPKTALSELWPDWSSRVQQAVEATRTFLQLSSGGAS